MTDHAGVVRDEAGLGKGLSELAGLEDRPPSKRHSSVARPVDATTVPTVRSSTSRCG